MQVTLSHAQLLSLDIRRPTLVCSINGIHWVSWHGRDLVLAQGQSVVLHAGQALINGEGSSPSRRASHSTATAYMGTLHRWIRAGLPAMQPSALHIDIV